EEQENFLGDESVESVDKVVERLLASQQHGVQYGRHWLDVLRYADRDEDMPAAPGIHLWRDWVISALNQDLPYDEFVRAQICGNRAAKRRIISALGFPSPVEPRPEDLFALGFLARGAAVEQHKSRLDVLTEKMRRFIAPYHDRLYEERLSLLPDDVQAAIRKPEKERTAREQKIADDYYPVLRIDPPKIKAVMSAD